MSKQLFVLCTILLMLAFPIAVNAQEDPVFVLSEEQINAEFTLPSTAARTVANLAVDVEEDGVQVSFDMTVARNGSTSTYNIIAVLIGLSHVRIMEFKDAWLTEFSATPSQRREVARVVSQAWELYLRGVLEENLLDGTDLTLDDIEALMESGGIHFYAADNVPIDWCLECAKP